MSGKPLSSVVDLLKDIELGPAMEALSEKQREFVYAMIEYGGLNYAQAAREAGYECENPGSFKVIGYRLAHDKRIQEAMREMGPKLLNAGIFIAAKYVLETINNPSVDTKDRLKASEMVMNRTGMHATSEHKVAVTHKSESAKEVLLQIEQMSKQLGVDPKKLLGVNVTDAEFEEVPAVPEDDLSDIL